MELFWKDLQIYLDIETFFTLLGFKVFPLLLPPPPPFYSWPYIRNRVPDKNIWPAMISTRNMYFGRQPEISYRDVMDQDTNRCLPWCAADMHFPNGLRSG